MLAAVTNKPQTSVTQQDKSHSLRVQLKTFPVGKAFREVVPERRPSLYEGSTLLRVLGILSTHQHVGEDRVRDHVRCFCGPGLEVVPVISTCISWARTQLSGLISCKGHWEM